jgi:hypothetical protein
LASRRNSCSTFSTRLSFKWHGCFVEFHSE